MYPPAGYIKMFTVQATVFTKTDPFTAERVYTRFHIHCLMADNERWKNVPVPRMSGDVEIWGDLIGFCTVEPSACPCPTWPT